MPRIIYPDTLFEKPKEGSKQHTSIPQTNFTLPRLIGNHKRYWIDPNPSPVLKPKKLLIADHTARNWSQLKTLKVIACFSQLLEDGFSLYVWQNGYLVLLTQETLFYLWDPAFRRNISFESPEKIIEKALQQINRIGPDQLHVVDNVWMHYFLSDGSLALPLESIGVCESEDPIYFNYFTSSYRSVVFDRIPLSNPELSGRVSETRKEKHFTKINLVSLERMAERFIFSLFQRQSSIEKDGFTYEPNNIGQILELVTATNLMRKPGHRFLMSPSLESLSIHFTQDMPNIPLECNPTNLKVLQCIGPSEYRCSLEFFDEFLKHAQNLESLIWTGVQFPTLGLIVPMNFPNLKQVDLPLDISQSTIASLLWNSHQIESLTCIPLSQIVIEQLHFSELKELVYTDRKDSSLKANAVDLHSLLGQTPKLVNLVLDVHVVPMLTQTRSRPLSLPNLKKFIINQPYNDIDRAIISILMDCRQLEHVELRYVSFCEGDLPPICVRNPNLRNLSLPKSLAAVDLMAILLHCHHLKRLTVPQSPNLEFSAQTGVPRLAELEFLEISNPKFEDFKHIVAEAIFLKELVLANCIWLSASAEFPGFSNLTTVTLNGDCKIGRENLAKLLVNAEEVQLSELTLLSHICFIPLPKLKNIKLGYTQQFSHAQLENLLSNIPRDACIEGQFSSLQFNSAEHQDLKDRLLARGAKIVDGRPLHERFPLHVVDIALDPDLTASSGQHAFPRPSSGSSSSSNERRVAGATGSGNERYSTPTRAQENRFMDANTSADNTPEFHVTRVFFPVHAGQSSPAAQNMRIDVYQDLIVNPAHCDIDHAFEIKKTGDLLINPPEQAIRYVQTDDLFAMAQQQTPIAGQKALYAKKVFALDAHWQAMPSMSAQEIMTHIHADPGVEIQYSSRDNLYYIRANSSKPCVVEWLITVPTAPPIALPDDMAYHVARYQTFGKGALSFPDQDLCGQDYLTCMEIQAKGACRHRACAFKAFMTDQYPGVPVRIISNGCHMFVEVQHAGQWVSCDLGGYPAKLTLDESNNPQPNHAPETTEDICPESSVVPDEQGVQQDAQAQTNDTVSSSINSDQQISESTENIRIEEGATSIEQVLEGEIASSLSSAAMSTSAHIEQEQLSRNQAIPQQAHAILSGLMDELISEFFTTFYYQKRLETWLKSDSEPSITTYYEQLGIRGKNHLVELGNTQDVNTLSLSLEQYWHSQGRPVYYIDSPDDLRCSGPFLATTGYTENGDFLGQLKRGPGGPLHAFLTSHRDDDPVVIVNYAAFEADDMVRLNSLLDKTRRADSTPVPKKATVVGLINVNKPDCYQGSDFYSRFHRVTECSLPSQVLQATLPSLVQTVEHSATLESIDLFHASDWETKLIGRWVLNRGQFHFEKGELVKALERNERHITIQNGLWGDPTFVRFWQSLAVHKKLQYAGQSIDVPADFTCFKSSCDAYDWPQLSRGIQRIQHRAVNPDAQILNPSLLPQFFGHYQCDNASESLYPLPGLIQTAKERGILTVQVTRALSEDNWAMLVTACAKEDISLRIDCPDSIALPWDETPVVAESEHLDFDGVTLSQLQTAVIASTDIDSTVAMIQQSSAPWIVLDVSDYEAPDLLTRIEHKFDKRALLFKFKQKDAALLELLDRGKQVILKGKFSPELLDHLSQLIHARFSAREAPGRLILVQDNKAQQMALPTLTHTVTVAKKLELLELPANQTRLTLTQLQQESLNRLKTRLDQANPWQGMEGLPPHSHISPIDWAQSHDIAQRFDKDRIKAVNTRLKHKPYVFLTGLTSVGKTSFVEKMFTDKQGKLYRGEQSLKRWALSKSRRRRILFIDEANFQEWSNLEGLLNDPPGIVIEGSYYPLTKNHKIIFAGNPLNYGDERKLAKLFHTHGNALVFNPMPPEYIYERIIKPVFPEELLGLAPEMSVPWLEVYAFLCARSTQDVLISARELQMMALLTLSYHARNPDVPIKRVAAYYAYHVAKHLVPTLYQSSFSHQFPDPDPLPALDLRDPNVPQTDFRLTASRQPLVNQLTELLSLRSYKRSEFAAHDAQRYGGLGGIVIEGESGIGKSELVTTLLKQCGYAETHYSAPSQLDGNRYYRLSVDMDMTQKIQLLHQAFDEGSIVVIDEINSSPMMERLLNSLLMGQTLKGKRPQRPGFMIIGTQNPITLSGRRAPSNALSRRLMTVTLPPYPRDEMIDIMASKIGYERATQLVKVYEEQRTYALENKLKPIPTFRDVIKIADEEAGIIYAPTNPVAEFDSDLVDADETDDQSIASDLSDQEWSDWDEDDLEYAAAELGDIAADPAEPDRDNAHENSDSESEDPVIEPGLDEQLLITDNVLLRNHGGVGPHSAASEAVSDPLAARQRVELLPLRNSALSGRPRSNCSFYLLWMSAVIFAILAMIALCLALNVGIATAFGLAPVAMQLGTALLGQTAPLYLSLYYAAIGFTSGLVSMSFFKMGNLPPSENNLGGVTAVP